MVVFEKHKVVVTMQGGCMCLHVVGGHRQDGIHASAEQARRRHVPDDAHLVQHAVGMCLTMRILCSTPSACA
jgi:hypothetical protein